MRSMNKQDVSSRRNEARSYYESLYCCGTNTIPSEIWLPVVGYESKYSVSSLGRVMRTCRKIHPTPGLITKTFKHRLVKPAPDESGYMALDLYDEEGKPKHHSVHRLVATAFLPNPESKPTVNHIDGVTWHNCVDNLEWATYKEQQQHGWKLGLYVKKRTNTLEEIKRAWTKSVAVRSKKVYCIEDDIEYSSIAEAERAVNNGVCNGNLCTALRKYDGRFKGKHYILIEA